MSNFHYAFKVMDISSTRRFYNEILGCEIGRSTDHWIDFNFFGNQLSAHISDDRPELDFCGQVDGVKVPIPHFGCLLDIPVFKKIQKRLEDHNVEFLIEPQIRYKGKHGEQWTMFVFDFSGNPIEFKAYSDKNEVF